VTADIAGLLYDGPSLESPGKNAAVEVVSGAYQAAEARVKSRKAPTKM